MAFPPGAGVIAAGFDLRALQSGFKAHKTRGIGVYTRNLISRAGLAPAELSIIPFYDPRYESAEALSYGAVAYERGWLSAKLTPHGREYINQRLFMRRVTEQTCAKSGTDIMFFPSHLDTPPGLSIPYVVMAHDMIQSALAEKYYGSWKHRLTVAMQKHALQSARLIIAVSDSTKTDVTKYAGVDPGKIVTVYNGVDPVFRPGGGCSLERFRLPEKFILNVGGIDWRKNMELLFDAFEKLQEKRPEYHLVMTGAIEDDPQYIKFLSHLTRRGLSGKVRATGFVSTEELVALYNRAEVFFYPSVYEGFGLPVLEAMACGTPVIATNRSSIPEVGGNAAVLLNPDEPDKFAEVLLKLTDDEKERERLSLAGIKQAAGFSWDRCAENTYKALAMAAGY